MIFSAQKHQSDREVWFIRAPSAVFSGVLVMKSILIFLLALVSVNALAESPAVYEKSVDQNLETAYKHVYKALESNGFKVVYEVDIQENLTKFAAKNAIKDFNLSQLEGIKSMVFCNGPLAVKISNADPTMLAMCPLHLTLTQKAGRATVLFVRPSFIAQGSKAEAPAKELEEKVIKAIESGLDGAQ
jgi:uncharacterized protein (DUF302 family)